MASNRRRRKRNIAKENYDAQPIKPRGRTPKEIKLTKTKVTNTPKANTPKAPKIKQQSLQQQGLLNLSTEAIPLESITDILTQESQQGLPLQLPTPDEAIETLSNLESLALEAEADQAQDYFNQITEAQNEEIPTIDFGRETIDMFLYALQQIYNDTIDKYSNPDTAETFICSLRLPQMEETYTSIVNEINKMIDTGVPTEIIGQAIADNVELDYTIALQFIPPSDCISHFEITLEQLAGVWQQINNEIAKRQEEMERNFE